MHNCYSIPVELILQDIRRQIDADQGVKSTSFHISHSPRSCGFRHIPLHSGQLLANVLLSRSDRTYQMCAIEIPIPYMSAGY